MIKCPKCHNDNPEGASYCGVCYEPFRNPTGSHPKPKGLPPPEVPLWTHSRRAAAAALFLVLAWYREPVARACWLLDGVDLAFHEAGHLFFGILGIEFLTVLGGTLMQLILPMIAAISFWKRGDLKSADLTLAWVGQNFFGIGRYMADSREQALPLVGGGGHDWTYLFEKTGLIIHDVGIGQGTQVFGCAVIAFALVRLYGRWRLEKAAPAATASP